MNAVGESRLGGRCVERGGVRGQEGVRLSVMAVSKCRP